MLSYRGTFALLTALTSIVSTAKAASISVSVLNSSFESPVVGMDGNPQTTRDGDDYLIATPDDWLSFNGPPPFDGVLTRGSGGFFEDKLAPPPGPTGGEQNYWSNGSDVYQLLSVFLLPNTLYALTVDVGARTDTGLSEGSEIRLGVGATPVNGILTPQSFTNPAPPVGGWATWENVYATGPNPGDLDKPLRIELVSGGGAQVQFDNVRLSYELIPEPSSILLCLIGLLGLAGYCCYHHRVSQGGTARARGSARFPRVGRALHASCSDVVIFAGKTR